jgi:hypothetical protein
MLSRAARLPIVVLALAACASASSGVAAARPSPDAGDAPTRREVLAVVQRLFDAMAARDSAAMRAVFEPGARLVGMRTRPDGSTVMQSLPWERFAAFVAGDTRARWTERAIDPEVRVRGTLATVWAHYTFHFGETPSHCGVDAVQLLRTADGWRIVSIADTYETTGCPWQREATSPGAAR